MSVFVVVNVVFAAAAVRGSRLLVEKHLTDRHLIDTELA
jgi:hypothetical protein